jgi:hypothetical protein
MQAQHERVAGAAHIDVVRRDCGENERNREGVDGERYREGDRRRETRHRQRAKGPTDDETVGQKPRDGAARS